MKKALLFLDFPRNWLNQPAQFLEHFQGQTALDIMLERLKRAGLEALASLHINASLSQVEDLGVKTIEMKLKQAGVPCVIASDAHEANRLQEVFDLDSSLSHVLKLRPEDFMAPAGLALEALNSAGSEDYIFSVNYPTGLNFEIFTRKATQVLQGLNFEKHLPLRYVICRVHPAHFIRRRYMGDFVDEAKPQFRFTLDNARASQGLGCFLKHNEFTRENLESFAIQNDVFLQRLVEPFFDHRKVLGEVLKEPMIVQFLERGLFFRRYLNRHTRLLDICSGGMVLAQHIYSTATSQILCVDGNPDSQKLHADLELSKKGIRFMQGSVLDKACWQKIQDQGPFDVVTWTAAIEHFTESDQMFVAEQISKVLAPGGFLAGDTILFVEEGIPGCWQHKNEFTSSVQLENIFRPYFKEVDVFVSDYKDVPLQPVYFRCLV